MSALHPTCTRQKARSRVDHARGVLDPSEHVLNGHVLRAEWRPSVAPADVLVRGLALGRRTADDAASPVAERVCVELHLLGIAPPDVEARLRLLAGRVLVGAVAVLVLFVGAAARGRPDVVIVANGERPPALIAALTRFGVVHFG